MCNGVVYEVLADLAKKKGEAYKKGEKGLDLAQQIDAVEMHVKQMIGRRPIDVLIPQGEPKELKEPKEDAGSVDLSQVGV